MSLALAETIKHEYYKDRMLNAVIYGRQGMGKSSYAIQVMKQLYDDNEWRDWFLFSPREVVNAIVRLRKNNLRVPAITIDDASRVFYYMNYANTDVKNALNWIAWARTSVGGIMFTTPQVGLLLKKITTFEGTLVGKVTMSPGKMPDRRVIKLYSNSIAVWGKRYISEVMSDSFNVMLDQEDFDWYKPKRAGYLDASVREMEAALALQPNS